MTSLLKPNSHRGNVHWSRLDAVLLQALWVAVLLAVALALLSSLAPPRNADAMIYHLAQPKEMLRSGVFTALPYYTYNFPRTFHLLFVIGEWLGWPSLSALISWVAVLLTSMGVVKTARLVLVESGDSELPSGLAEAVCLGAMYLTPGILQIAAVPSGDGGLLCFFTWGTYILLAEASSESPRRVTNWVLSGVLLGLAIGTKYHGLLLVAVFEVAFAWFLLFGARIRRRRLRGDVRLYAYHLIGALVVGSPFYLFNLIQFGNPIWPLFAASFGTASDLHTQMAAFGQRGAAQSWSLTENIMGHVLEPFCVNSILLAGVYAVARRASGVRGVVAATVFGYIAAAIMLTRFHRYWLPVWPQAGVISAYGIALMYNSRIGAHAARLLIGVAIVSGTSFAVLYSTDFVKWAVGVMSSEDIRRMSFFYEDYEWLNNNLDPEVDTVLVVPTSGHTYYLDIPYIRADPFMAAVVDWEQECVPDCSQMARLLDQLGITYVLIGIDDPLVRRVITQLEEEGVVEEVVYTPERRLLYQRMKRTYGSTPVWIYRVDLGSERITRAHGNSDS